ncbi:bifunctional aspartate kinase/homoserine dehydrogenase II [Ferrimonas sediminicola]|uniref:Bifunctional aspartokinase/homoserine dehydrogenase n=1 Tax=Ferrimonas sediminicola TaxID=2569538 RepID=A0A4U1BJ35_9GAMM|nr:bifunctional aspartate kinase/homoserine dehydrogenase II [Ferrimonas sediminicola]TKB51165.1 bifunctional aspartate kinase/homoserine dehydrogenase II [Ferrimonas sediminicola]
MTGKQLHKFGGSSLADAECYHRVAHIVQTHGHAGDLVVVSAAGKTTNALLDLLRLARHGQPFEEALAELKRFQQTLVSETLGASGQPLSDQLAADIAHIGQCLGAEPRDCAAIQAFGELWSARLLAALLSRLGAPATALDARDFLLLDDSVQPRPDWARSAEALHRCLAQRPNQRVVVTGYFGANAQGRTRLLGRNGSDYSATLIAALAEAAEVTIWTDVAGIYNADPNLLADARLQASLSLDEADQLARLGSPVLHSRTLQPLRQVAMALNVRSSYTPDSPYTRILPRGSEQTEPVVTSLGRVTLYRFQGKVPAFHQLCDWLGQQGLPPLADYDQPLMLALTCEQSRALGGDLARQAASLGLTLLSSGDDYGLVGLVSQHPGRLAGAFARLLSRSAYPCCRHDQALVTLVPSREVTALVESIHRRCAGPRRRIGLVLAGKGNIGSAWLDLFSRQQQQLNEEFEAEMRLVGIIGSEHYLIDEAGIDPARWQGRYQQEARECHGLEWLDRAAVMDLDEVVLLDITASASLALHYPEIVAAGLHLVSANKQAGSGPGTFYRELQRQLSNCHRYWRYNASVGAGLPVFYSIDDLKRSGDAITSVSGVFSGTLSWLFDHYDRRGPFSELVLQAKSEGLTEPDPRDDLSGRDMQRKLLILARELGLTLELEQIELESLVPAALADLPLEQFLARIEELDPLMQAAADEAKARGLALRYAASLTIDEAGVRARVGLEQVAHSHPFANLPAGDNQFLFLSKHYPNGLVIQGPGAGREVTAAAVQSDFVAICRRLLH